MLNGLAILALFLLCILFLAKSSTMAITIAKGTTANTMNNTLHPYHTQVSCLNAFELIGGPTYVISNNSPVVWLGHLATSEKQYRENLYQVLLSLSKPLCNCSSVQANIFATIPKQNTFALSLVNTFIQE